MSEDYLFDKEEVKGNVLRFLQALAKPLEEIKKPWPGCDKGVITVEDSGVRANLAARYWSDGNGLLVLSILALFEIPVLNEREVVEWIKCQQHDKGYFRSRKLGRKVSQATYNACATLRLLGTAQDDTGWDRAKLIELLRAQQQPGERRHFAFMLDDRRGQYAELENAFYCIASLAALGETVPEPEAAIRYLQRKQSKSGEIKKGLVKGGSYFDEEATLDLIRSLKLLSSNLRYCLSGVSTIQSWQLTDGGFDAIQSRQGAPNISNVSNTARSILSLYLLGAAPFDKGRCRQRVARLWVPKDGYFLYVPGATVSVGSHTLATLWLGLLAMATLDMFGPVTSRLLDLVMYTET